MLPKDGGKLVRDKIPDLVMAEGIPVTGVILKEDNDYAEALVNKLYEECAELAALVHPRPHMPVQVHSRQSKDEIASEIADCLEILGAITQHCGCTPDQVKRIRDDKRDAKGGFGARRWAAFNEAPEEPGVIDA